jgi:hypothetical protein
MKTITTVFLTLLFLIAAPVFAQEIGDYRTHNTGDWNDNLVWQTFNGSIWGQAPTPPTGEETITIMEEDSVYINVDITISGTLVVQGDIGESEAVNITVADGGTWQHDRDGGRLPNVVTWAEGSTFLITGTTGVAPDNRGQNYYNITFNTPDKLSNLHMNLNDNTVGGDINVIQTGLGRWHLTSVDAGDTATITILGDVIVHEDAGAGFTVQGTSNAQTTFIVHHYGNINVMGSNFSVSRGSQPLGTTHWYLYEGDFHMENATTQSSSTPGSAAFVFAGDLEIQNLILGEGNTLTRLPIEVADNALLNMGDVVLAGDGHVTVHAGGTLITELAGGTAAIFGGTYAGVVTLEEGSGYGYAGSEAQITSDIIPDTLGNLLIENPAGVTLSKAVLVTNILGIFEGTVDNSAGLTLGADVSLGTGLAGGVEEAVAAFSEPIDPDEIENYWFFGEVPQITSTAMPQVVNNLMIDNDEGVTLSQETVINGVLYLFNGVFDNTIPFELGPNGSIEIVNGSLLVPPVSVEEPERNIPESFFVDQNYPNPFNPATTIRFGLPATSQVSVNVYNILGQRVAALFDGVKDAGVHELHFDASNLGSGVYLYRIQAGESVQTKQMMLVK